MDKYTKLKVASWQENKTYSFSWNGYHESFTAYMYFQRGTGFLFYVREDGVPRAFPNNCHVYIKDINN